MDLKSESFFWGEPKGSSAFILQIIKKQKLFFYLFFVIGSLERNLNLGMC